jgi:hypothetical protein
MSTIARLVLLLVVALTAGCSVSRDANPAERCDSALDCVVGFECRYGFCIDPGASDAGADDGDGDGDLTDVTQPVDANEGNGDRPEQSALDAGVMLDAAPTVPAEAADAAVEPPPTPSNPPPVPMPEGPQCKPSETMCGKGCVDLLRDGKHCGACGHKCEKGECSAGKCEREADDEGDDDD